MRLFTSTGLDESYVESNRIFGYRRVCTEQSSRAVPVGWKEIRHRFIVKNSTLERDAAKN